MAASCGQATRWVVCLSQRVLSMGSAVVGQPELDLRKLEEQVDELLSKVDALSSENRSLRQQKDGLVSERARLLDKTESARNRVEAMIARLKAMERD